MTTINRADQGGPIYGKGYIEVSGEKLLQKFESLDTNHDKILTTGELFNGATSGPIDEEYNLINNSFDYVGNSNQITLEELYRPDDKGNVSTGTILSKAVEDAFINSSEFNYMGVTQLGAQAIGEIAYAIKSNWRHRAISGDAPLTGNQADKIMREYIANDRNSTDFNSYTQLTQAAKNRGIFDPNKYGDGKNTIASYALKTALEYLDKNRDYTVTPMEMFEGLNKDPQYIIDTTNPSYGVHLKYGLNFIRENSGTLMDFWKAYGHADDNGNLRRNSDGAIGVRGIHEEIISVESLKELTDSQNGVTNEEPLEELPEESQSLGVNLPENTQTRIYNIINGEKVVDTRASMLLTAEGDPELENMINEYLDETIALFTDTYTSRDACINHLTSIESKYKELTGQNLNQLFTETCFESPIQGQEEARRLILQSLGVNLPENTQASEAATSVNTIAQATSAPVNTVGDAVIEENNTVTAEGNNISLSDMYKEIKEFLTNDLVSKVIDRDRNGISSQEIRDTYNDLFLPDNVSSLDASSENLSSSQKLISLRGIFELDTIIDLYDEDGDKKLSIEELDTAYTENVS